jgi:hypothetical protein
MTKQAVLENKPSIFKIMDTIKLNEFLFQPPGSIKNYHHIYNVNLSILKKLKKEFELSGRKQRFRKLTLYLNDLLPQRFEDAKQN